MDVLRLWLADAGIQSQNIEQVRQQHSSGTAGTSIAVHLWVAVLEFFVLRCLLQDFSSGYLFAKLLEAHALQPDLHAFQNKGRPDAYLNNYMRLQVVVDPNMLERVMQQPFTL